VLERKKESNESNESQRNDRQINDHTWGIKQGNMGSFNHQKKERGNTGKSERRPFSVFHVKRQSPEEIHLETIMAPDIESARKIAIDSLSNSTVLHVRGIGETSFLRECNDTSPLSPPTLSGPLPGARFIKGEFHATSEKDEKILDSLAD